MERESLERCLADGMSLEEIGQRFGKHRTTVAYWLKKYGLRAVHAERFAPKRSGVSRELLERLVGEGRSLASIGEELGLSASTARYWLTKYGLRTTVRRGCAQARRAREAGHRFTQLECIHHGRTRFVLESTGYYRCLRCRSERVMSWRRRRKGILVREAGGRCRLCGYDRCLGALHFHHLDPSGKSFGVSQQGMTRSLARTRAEARKCVLLCSNCHAEVEAGIAALPGPPQESLPML